MGDSNDDDIKKMDNPQTTLTVPPADVRESLVKTAVQFLQNPKTRASSLKLKILFLKKKGLTEDEIQLAIDRSGTALYEEAKNRIRDATQPQPMLPPNSASNYHQQMVAQPITPFSIVRDIANTVVAIGGIGYLVYWFYTNFIKPWLFGKKKPKPVSDQLTDLEASLTEIKQEVRSGLARVGADLESLANQRAAERSHDLHDLSAQVQTVKGLLLNRSQFPAVPPTTLGSPAKIPSWQLAVEEQVGNSGSEKEVNKAENKMAEGKEKQAEEEEVEDDEDDGDDEEESSKSLAEASDSSLEMINSITNHHD